MSIGQAWLKKKNENGHLKRELERAYRAISGLYTWHKETGKPNAPLIGYHSMTIAAARRFVKDGALDGSDYFEGKPVEVLQRALAE